MRARTGYYRGHPLPARYGPPRLTRIGIHDLANLDILGKLWIALGNNVEETEREKCGFVEDMMS